MSDFYTVKKYDGVSYEDFSLQLKEFDTPAISLELTTASELYVGLRKPFDSFFVELDTKSIAGATLSGEYYDGSTWKSLVVYDESQGFSSNGFIYFEKPEDMAATEVDGLEKFYIRIKTDIDTGAVGAKYLDVLFSSDLDITKIRANIVTKFSVNGTWARKHIAARDHIIQEIRNRGNVKVIKVDNGSLTEEIYFKDVNQFDFLEPLQLRVASTYLALYFIFWYELSDEEGDKWQIKAAEMYRLYENAVELFFLALDLDDDGKTDTEGGDKSDSTGSIRTIVTG